MVETLSELLENAANVAEDNGGKLFNSKRSSINC